MWLSLNGRGSRATPKLSMSNLPKCPKCKGQTYVLSVVVEESLEGQVTDGVNEGLWQCALPLPVRAYGNCSLCGHKWQIRNASTAQLLNDDTPKE